MAYQHPFPESTVTSEWGETAGRPNPHRGRDYAPGGPPAPSIVVGRVVRSEYQSGLGNVVVIRNDVDGYNIGYCHLAERWVSVGQRVGVGTMVGVVGNTGTLSAGRHLHFTVQQPAYSNPGSGPTIDPRTYIRSSSSVASGGGSTGGLSKDTQLKYQQLLTNLKLYDGIVDGAFGPKSWVGVQQHLTNLKLYSGPVDGVPGANTLKGMQTLAKQGGYSGPIDGVWGINSDAGLNKYLTSRLTTAPAPAPGEFGDPIPAATQRQYQELLTRLKLYSGNIDGAWGQLSWSAIQQHMKNVGVYTGVVDGVPGNLSYQGLQKLAAKEGYDGPIDGVMGPRSIEGLSTYLAAQLAGTGGIPTTPPPVVAPGIPVLPVGLMFGIDIARYQSTIDLPKFYAGGGKFTIFKVGGSNSGDAYTDAKYNDYVVTARGITGAKIGHYWFNGKANGQTPKTAAREMFARMKLMVGDLIFLDVEDETASGTKAYTPEEAKEFVLELQALLGGHVKVGLYMSSSVERAADWSWFKENGHFLWVAAYNANDGKLALDDGPNLSGDTAHNDWKDDEWSLWQYASAVARVPGYQGDIDVNVARSDVFDKYGYRTVEQPEPVIDWEAEFKKLWTAQANVVGEFEELALAAH